MVAHIVSAEETTTQVQVVFAEALAAEGLLAAVEARQDEVVDPCLDDERRADPVGHERQRAANTSGSTREFMALCAIHQHLAGPAPRPTRPGSSHFFGHLKYEFPHLLKIADPAVLRAELEVIRTDYNGVHSSLGYRSPAEYEATIHQETAARAA